MHYEPLRVNRMLGAPEPYEFTHGAASVCVYALPDMDFIREIPVGTKPDCHALSGNGKWLYIATLDGLYAISVEELAVRRVLDTGRVYATNVLPDGETMLVHDEEGGVLVLDGVGDAMTARIRCRRQVLPERKYRSEIGGKGSLIDGGRYYLCAGWHAARLFTLDTANDFAPAPFCEPDPRLDGGDDLVLNADKTKAYVACHRGASERGHVAVVDVARREILTLIPTGTGTCGLTMTPDERCAVASNDGDESVSVIDTASDTVVNTPSAREALAALGTRGYIQGISGAPDGSVFVYGCSGSGALVRFTDILASSACTVSFPGGKLTFGKES